MTIFSIIFYLCHWLISCSPFLFCSIFFFFRSCSRAYNTHLYVVTDAFSHVLPVHILCEKLTSLLLIPSPCPLHNAIIHFTSACVINPAIYHYYIYFEEAAILIFLPCAFTSLYIQISVIYPFPFV